MNIAAATRTTAAPGSVPAWPAAPWRTWTPTADPFTRQNPIDVMQAAPIAPNAHAVAQADFAFGGNYMAHGSLDVFTGALLGRFTTRDAAFAAAQALKGAHGIVGVFASDDRFLDRFVVRELLVSDADRRGAGDDYRSPRPPARPRPTILIPLTDVGKPNGSWGHGDYRTLSALRFVSPGLLGFVRGADSVVR